MDRADLEYVLSTLSALLDELAIEQDAPFHHITTCLVRDDDGNECGHDWGPVFPEDVLTDSRVLVVCTAGHLTTYAPGRAMGTYDIDEIQRIARRVAEEGGVAWPPR